MKLKSLTFLAAAAVFAFAAPRAADARTAVSFDFFYDSLSPYGEWLEVGDYGRCWRPSGVDADWSPYSDGYWSYTDGGWTWVSYEDFGGIVYHYGRWAQVEDEGWCWVPDEEWAPAWVSWRSSDDYVGWAPLPPEARWRRDTGFSVWVDAHYDIGPARFNFCRVRDFGAPYLRPVICHRRENVVIIQSTANVTNISYYDGGGYGGLVHCGGPSFVTVNRYAERPIPALKLVHNTNITNINIKQVNVFNAVQRGNQLTVLAPRISAPTAAITRPLAARTIPAAKVTKGWAAVKDAEVATAIRSRMQRESRGLTPETAPARLVRAEDLKVLPKKADPTAVSPVKTAKQRGTAARQIEPARVPAEKPIASEEKPVVKPVDPRIAEKNAREKAREAADDKPATKTAPVVTERKAQEPPMKPTITEIPEPKPATTAKTLKDRKAPRTITPATVNPPATEKKVTIEPPDRPPTVKSVPKTNDDDARARAAASARARALTEQKERAATMERSRVVTEAPKKQKVQVDDGAEQQRRLQMENARRQQQAESTRMRANDDAARKQDAAQAARLRSIQSQQQQQAIDNARRQQAEAVRRQPVEQQAPVVRREAPVKVQRQPPVQVQRQVPAPVPQKAPAASNGKRQLTAEEIAERKKK